MVTHKTVIGTQLSSQASCANTCMFCTADLRNQDPDTKNEQGVKVHQEHLKNHKGLTKNWILEAGDHVSTFKTLSISYIKNYSMIFVFLMNAVKTKDNYVLSNILVGYSQDFKITFEDSGMQ